MNVYDIKQAIKKSETELQDLKELLIREESKQFDRITKDFPQPHYNFHEWQKYEIPQGCLVGGIQQTGVMEYCCPNANCPTGMGPISC